MYSVLMFCVSVLVAAGYDPAPNPDSVVSVGKARFTILTSHIIRMEWGGIVDSATFAFINRNLPTPPYNISTDGGWTTITTSAIQVRYLPDQFTFNNKNLEVSIQLNGNTVVWQPTPGANATLNGNLLGTVRTLDGVNGSVDLNCYEQPRADLHCQLGLVSSNGYVVIDDSGHPQFDGADWPWVVNQTFPPPDSATCAQIDPLNVRQQILGISFIDCFGKGCCFELSGNGIPQCFYGPASYQDLYFFGHGHDYKLALKEFTMIAGPIPLPPRYAFGIYYSRYWAYNDIDEMNIVEDYEQRGIPLDTLVTDMDWHITFYKEADKGQKDQAGQTIGWTGFTWDQHLFPNPKGFLDWCKSKNLKNTLNLHPASGIQPWEEMYPEMAEAMGIDPKTQRYVPFDPTDFKFVVNWFLIALKAREDEGIDFWWLDWQQGESWISIPLVNPTFWLNHIFYTNPYHWSTTNPAKRPHLLHRWGGLGNHRYQVGFSGDVVPSWGSLDFQVYFTLKATNVGYGYWSHDLGGHTQPSPPELYTRWVQWGAFSPMFRTHCTKNADNFRQIWLYPNANYEILRQAIRLRASLIPYIYTYARWAYDEGLSLLRPMYYEYPDLYDEAYIFDHQYFFGHDILVAPVTHAVDTTTQLAMQSIWMPPGTYISWFSGEKFDGPQTVNRSFTLSEIPLFVRDGSIIPMRTDDFAPLGSAETIPASILFMIFIANADSGSSYLYEDDGVTVGYTGGSFSNTTVTFTINRDINVLDIIIGPTVGEFLGMPSTRSYQVNIPNFWPADTVYVNGRSLPYMPLETSFASYSQDCWTYDGSSLSLIIIMLSKYSVIYAVNITVSYKSFEAFDPYWFTGYSGKLKRFIDAKDTLDDQWGLFTTVYQEDYFALLNATEVGMRITYDPQNILSYSSAFPYYASAAIEEIQNLQRINETIQHEILAQLTVP
ncbi:hypothetical protein EMCRGX_G019505 [Ephydatia muelleri]